MPARKTHKCPLCKSLITKARFDQVTNIQATRQKQLDEADRKLREAKVRQREAKKVGQLEGKKAEKSRSERLVKGLKKKLTIATERIGQLQKGTTPQTEGLEFEDRLCARLTREFPDDQIVHEGKGGDVLHTVISRRKPAGLILYECKRTQRIQRQHIEQAMRDKRNRHADFAILVTTGQRRGFTGLDQDGPIILVAPLGVIPLVHLVRAHLLEVAKAKLSKDQQAKIATALVDYITSPVFKGPIEEAVAKATRARELLGSEIRSHLKMWEERHNLYHTVAWDLDHIRQNVERVLQGAKPVSLVSAKPQQLQLPPSSGSRRTT